MNETPIKSIKAKDDIGETEVTLVADTMIDNWDEFADDENADYAWNFAQLATHPTSTSIQNMTIESLQVKQPEVFNKVQGRLHLFWIVLDNQLAMNVFFSTIFLQNMWKVNKELHLVYINVGMLPLMKQETCPDLELHGFIGKK